ncbi:MAG TPA: SDR family oxidoreductase [Acidimicrobiales bacterium]|nr:SDR family oxidoreductase [Acidimicrobiales bacterium]
MAERRAAPGPRPHGLFSLDGQVSVVIGGTGTVGRGMAAALLAAGSDVVVAGRDADRGAEAVDVLGGGRFVVCDTTRRDQLDDLVGDVVRTEGWIDILVNAAGVNSTTPFLEIGDDELEALIDTNATGVARACQAFGRYFVDRAAADGVGASIINVGSESARRPLSKVFTYSMAKAAVHNLTKNLAREWGPLGIRCNVLVPGFLPAEQNRAILDPERVAGILEHTPLRRLGEPGDLDGALLLLASDAGRFITGSELVVDGGFDATSL